MKRINLKTPTPRSKEKSYTEFDYPIRSRKFLSDPILSEDMPFTKVLSQRKTRRVFNPLPYEKLNALLWYSARTNNILPASSGGRAVQHRPSPSAGAKHPVDIFVIQPGKFFPRISLYQNIPHALALLEFNSTKLRKFLNESEKVLPYQQATILWFGAQFDRTLSKYKNGESLVWRDAGALIGVMTLVAEFLELACCPIGITGEPYFSNIFENSTITGVGGIYIGSVPKN